MISGTARDVSSITPIRRRIDAAEVATAAYDQLLVLLRTLAPADWSAPTECPGWDVAAVVGHLIGAGRSNASLREFARQQLYGIRHRAQPAAMRWTPTTPCRYVSMAARPRLNRSPRCKRSRRRRLRAGCVGRRSSVWSTHPSTRAGRPRPACRHGRTVATFTTSSTPATCGCTPSTSPARPGGGQISAVRATRVSSRTSPPNGPDVTPAPSSSI
ncbi:hypothetical protein GJV80_06670 [Microlunatus sp. Gsoil 973]|nr:hypothetical protein GJV80_06670 [Microlunatus sp. Gsoil 973]